MVNKVIYWDCDGVIAYFEELRRDFVRKKYPLIKETTHYDLRDHGFDLQEVIDFFHSEEYARKLRKMAPVDGAIEGLNSLFCEMDESNILTFRDSYDRIKSDTREWFGRLEAKYHNLFFAENKGQFIVDYGKPGILVEDAPHNIQLAMAKDIPCICVPWSYNTEIQQMKESPLLRTRSWINDCSGKSSLVECIQNEFDWENMRFKD